MSVPTKRQRPSEDAFEMISLVLRQSMEKDEQFSRLRDEDIRRKDEECAKKEALLREKIVDLERQCEKLAADNAKKLTTPNIRDCVNTLLDKELELDARTDAIRADEERISKQLGTLITPRQPVRHVFVFTYTGPLIDMHQFNSLAVMEQTSAGTYTQVKEVADLVDTGMHFCRLSFTNARTEMFVSNLIRRYHAHMSNSNPSWAMAFGPVFSRNETDAWRSLIINNQLLSPSVRYSRAPLWSWYGRENTNYADAIVGKKPAERAATEAMLSLGRGTD